MNIQRNEPARPGRVTAINPAVFKRRDTIGLEIVQVRRRLEMTAKLTVARQRRS